MWRKYPWSVAAALMAILGASYHVHKEEEEGLKILGAKAALQLLSLTLLLLLSNVLARQVLLRMLLSKDYDDLLVRCCLIFFPSTRSGSVGGILKEGLSPHPGPAIVRQRTTGAGALQQSITTDLLDQFEFSVRSPGTASQANQPYRSTLFVEAIDAARIAMPPVAATLMCMINVVLSAATAAVLIGNPAVESLCRVAFFDPTHATSAAALLHRASPPALRLMLLARIILPLDSAFSAIAGDICAAHAVTPASRQAFSFVRHPRE